MKINFQERLNPPIILTTRTSLRNSLRNVDKFFYSFFLILRIDRFILHRRDLRRRRISHRGCGRVEEMGRARGKGVGTDQIARVEAYRLGTKGSILLLLLFYLYFSFNILYFNLSNSTKLLSAIIIELLECDNSLVV